MRRIWEKLKYHKATIQENKREIIKSATWLVFIFALVYVFARLVGLENLEERTRQVGVFGPLLLITFKAATLVFAPLGGAPLYPIAGAAYGFWQGMLYMLLGDFLGATTAFYISRIFGKRIATHFVTKHGMKAVEDVLHHLGSIKGYVYARFIFIGLPEAVYYAAGLTTIPYVPFILISIGIGIIPTTILVGFGNLITEYSNTFLILAASTFAMFLSIGGSIWFYRQARKHNT